MNQGERRRYMLNELLKEFPMEQRSNLPFDAEQQKLLLRSILNTRKAAPVHEEFLRIQDAYLKEEIRQQGVVDIIDLNPVMKGIYLWKGDITTLGCGAIVNAANSALTGCYYPNHRCIDNCIHTYAGVQLRLKCHEIMKEQGYKEPTGKAKITPAYNLPCNYIIHTVGPIIRGKVEWTDNELLASCYRSCLKLADEYNLDSIAFCCISTGEYHFPNDQAAKIAVDTVLEYRQTTGSKIKVIFNVFKDYDEQIYKKILEEKKKQK